MSAALILPYEQEKGQDSSRVIAVSHADCSGRPKLLVTRELFQGQYVLRFPGGKVKCGELPYEAAAREMDEETNHSEDDSETGLIHLFTYADGISNHSTHIFVCGFSKQNKS